MLRILCLLSCLGAVFCGGIGLTGPLLEYPASTRTSIAYGNNAFLARFAAAPALHGAVATPLAATVHQGVIAQPLTAHTTITATAAPILAARTAVATPAVAVAAAPVARLATVAAPLVASAPVVSSVHHVPAVAQVPVTKYEAQPAVIQNVVDVANPKVATRKFEIRRPAIQKEFYDIEERVVVRPAGSAVVELDQPISKSQKGPTLVSPAAGVAAVRTVPYATHAHHSHALHTQAFLPALPALSIQAYPVQGPALQQPAIPSLGVSPIQPQPIGSSTPRPELDQAQFDDSDSISVENPELGIARSAQQQEQDQRQENLLQQRLLEQSIAQAEFQSQVQAQARAEQDFQARSQFEARAQQEAQARAQYEARAQQEAQARAQYEVRNQQEAQARAQYEARAQQEAQAHAQYEARAQQEAQARAQYEARAQQEAQARAQAEVRNQQENQARAEADARAQQVFQTRSRIFDQQQILDQQQVIDQLQARLRSQEETHRQSTGAAPVRENVEVSSRAGNVELGRSSIQVQEIPSVRNLPEVELSNQARLIALLTERGPVSELRSADGLDNRVRARVLSATPAPPNAQARDEKVSTRRVVVNRPIQTVQEVDVVEPFTKIERVAVNQPAFIKTARFGVANVPTSIPVHTYTHAHYAI